MKLSPDWRRILKRAWSVRWMALAGILSGLEAALPFFTDRIPPGLMAVASVLAVGGGFIARIVVQKNGV